ncbi:MAG: hypothetical protein EA353_07405 [Puniceicoccaceae bacterium]|nr:MAG: hypothetical protein EA353_07405 [Puniceicoccaceae bacterium]
MCRCIVIGLALYQVPASGSVRKEDFQMIMGFSSSAIYNSNVELNQEEVSDVVFRVEPRVELLKPKGFVRGRLGIGVAAIRYLDATENNSNNLVFLADLEAGKVFGEGAPVQLRTEFEQTNDADGLTGEIVRRETYGIGVNGRHRFGFGGGVFGSYNYRYLKSRTAGFSDVESRSWQVGGFYQPAADSFALELEFEQEQAQSKGGESGLENVTSIVSAGIRGPLVSTLSGSVRGGVQQSESDRAEVDSERAPFYAIALDWRYSSLLSVNFNGERRFVTDSSNRLRDQTTLSLKLRRELGGPWLVEMGVRYTENQFQEVNSPAGKATVRGMFTGVDYALADWGNLRWTFELDEARSSVETFNYQAYRAGVELSARF